jgi:4-hydroxy-2-oxoglutarate aldolase
MKNEKLKGIIAPITTPFLETGEVNYEGLKSNVQFYAKSCINGYLALGSNGENKSLTNDEKIEVLRIIIDNKSENQFVMAGCIFESTFETILYAKEFEKLGADFLTLLPPSYFKKQMTEAVLIKYFNDVAAAVDTPCLLYNAPQFCGGTELTVNLVKECAKNPKIVGMKDSSKGNVENFLFAVRDQICVMAGSADFFMNTLFMGGTGGVVSLANVFPGLVKELYELILAKKYEEAFKLNEKVLKLNKSVSGAGGVAAVKYAMDLAGLCGGAPRLPLLPLPEENKAKVKAALVAQGMLG